MFDVIRKSTLTACTLAATVAGAAEAARPQYIVTDLGSLGGRTTYATAMNDFDMVVGAGELASTLEHEAATPVTHAFVWYEGVMRDLGTLGGPFSEARSVNNRGEVVGMSLDAAGKPRAFYAYSGRMFDFNELVPIDPETDFALRLGHEPPPSRFGHELPLQSVVELNAINHDGRAVGCGYFWNDDAPHGLLFVPRIGTGTGFGELDPPEVLRHMVMPRRLPDFSPEWIPPQFDVIDLGELPRAGDCLPLDVNALDQVVGISGNRGFMWGDGAINVLDFSKKPSRGIACNDRGYTVGWWCHGAEGENTAAIWNYFSRLNLPLPNGATAALSEATDINERFEIVGWMCLDPGAPKVAVLWPDVTTAVDLNQVTAQPLTAPFRVLNLDEAIAVNEEGHIAGNGTVPEGRRAFILQVPKAFNVYEHDLKSTP